VVPVVKPYMIGAIDPGYERSAFVSLADGELTDFGILDNAELLLRARRSVGYDLVVIERIMSYGMPVGAEVFETVYWSGRFAEAAHPLPVHRIGRKAVKLHLCGQSRAKDPNVRQALIDRFGGPSAIGKKASPGPLYGISGDVWSALAVAVTFHDQEETKP
jgi:hypothetical protein